MRDEHVKRVNRIFDLTGRYLLELASTKGIVRRRTVCNSERDGSIESQDYLMCSPERNEHIAVSYSSNGTYLGISFGWHENRDAIPRASVWGQRGYSPAVEFTSFIESKDPDAWQNILKTLPPPNDRRVKKSEYKKQEAERIERILSNPRKILMRYATLLERYLPALRELTEEEIQAAQKVYRDRHKVKLSKNGGIVPLGS